MGKKIIERIRTNIVDGVGVEPYYGWVRVSLNYTMPIFVINYIINAIAFIATHIGDYKDLYSYNPDSNTWCHNAHTLKYMTLSLDMRVPKGIIPSEDILRTQFASALAALPHPAHK
jgi:hypothetical protein